MDRSVGWAVIGYGMCAVSALLFHGFNGFMGGLCVTIVTAIAGG